MKYSVLDTKSYVCGFVFPLLTFLADNCRCENNGVCIYDATGTGIRCDCPAGYGGLLCEDDNSECMVAGLKTLASAAEAIWANGATTALDKAKLPEGIVSTVALDEAKLQRPPRPLWPGMKRRLRGQQGHYGLRMEQLAIWSNVGGGAPWP